MEIGVDGEPMSKRGCPFLVRLVAVALGAI